MSSNSPTTPSASGNGVLGGIPRGDHPGRYAHADTPEGVSDELAALFLGDFESAAEASRAESSAAKPQTQIEPKGPFASRRPSVSLLVLGNLPVFAGAWASQYARDRQKASGRPLALLTLDDESARLEMFGAAEADVAPAGDLRRALASVARAGADLAVRLPEAEAGWIGGTCRVASMTILTGADDPAIVAAYRSFKAIVQDLPTDAPAPEMRVSIAGCDEPLAGEAGLKLAQAAERFLGLSVERETPVRQIDAGSAVELYHGSAPQWADVPDLLSQYLEHGASAGEVHVKAGSGSQFQPRRNGPPVGFEAEGVETPPVRVPDEQGPGPVAQADAAPDAAPLPAGLTAVDVACPYARGVGIAVDDGGVLHAVAWAEDSASASGAVRDLVVASSWLRDHVDLIAVVMGRRLSSEPSLRHLVLREARGALALAQGDLRVHVSVPRTGDVVDLN